jgi:hypothetical protein
VGFFIVHIVTFQCTITYKKYKPIKLKNYGNI